MVKRSYTFFGSGTQAIHNPLGAANFGVQLAGLCRQKAGLRAKGWLPSRGGKLVPAAAPPDSTILSAPMGKLGTG